jgi:uncharacterized protein with PQ loop repeat
MTGAFPMLEEIAVVAGSIMIIASWFPQIIRLLKMKSSEDLSLTFLSVISVGTLLLVPHSFAINDVFFMVLNSSAGGIAALTLLLAWHYRKK